MMRNVFTLTTNDRDYAATGFSVTAKGTLYVMQSQPLPYSEQRFPVPSSLGRMS